MHNITVKPNISVIPLYLFILSIPLSKLFSGFNFFDEIIVLVILSYIAILEIYNIKNKKIKKVTFFIFLFTEIL